MMIEETQEYNAADPKKVKRKESEAKRETKRELADLRAILDTQEGRRYFWKLLGYCGIFSISFTGDNYTYFNEGRRQSGLKILSDIVEADPHAYALMTKENGIDL